MLYHTTCPTSPPPRSRSQVTEHAKALAWNVVLHWAFAGSSAVSYWDSSHQGLQRRSLLDVFQVLDSCTFQHFYKSMIPLPEL